MSTRELALAALEATLDRLLALDPVARQRLAGLHGRVIALRLRGLGLTLYFVPDDTGRLQVLGSIAGEPDCTLEGSPLDLARAGDREAGPRQLFSGRVAIGGDTELGHRFGEILAGLEIDWEEALARIVGDPLAHEVGVAVRRATRWGSRTREVLASDLGEYLTEEARLVPSPDEATEFVQAVDRIRDDLERLAARVERLERRLGDQGGTPG